MAALHSQLIFYKDQQTGQKYYRHPHQAESRDQSIKDHEKLQKKRSDGKQSPESTHQETCGN